MLMMNCFMLQNCNGISLFFLFLKDLLSWGRCVIHTGAAASARTMDSVLHSPSPMNLAMCKHSTDCLPQVLSSLVASESFGSSETLVKLQKTF